METLLKNVRVETNYLTAGDYTYGTETRTVDILFNQDTIVSVLTAGETPDKNRQVIDGKNALFLPQLREMHCHFDKSKLGIPWTPIEPAATIVERFTREYDYLESAPLSFDERMKNLLDLELLHGATHFRSHIDVHPLVGQRYLEGAQKVLTEYTDKLAYELVAFPQHGLLRSNAYDEMKKALQNGASLVGGVDPLSLDGNLEKSLTTTFDLATQFDAPIDLHLHERGDNVRQTFAKIIALTEESGWAGKVTVSHAYGLKDLSAGERKELFPRLAENKITIISSIPLNPVIPPLTELRAAGVKTFIGCDNIYDCWSPFGNGDVLDKLNRYAEIFNLTSQQALTESLELVTNQPLIEPDGWVKTGMPANFTLVDATSTAEFVARKIPISASYYKGKKVTID
ncbi:amidohydrolase family protein [Enterococcus thailandicus]|uniref:amidohydrolase family protein n=1 Tax=Enterococcus thailandicus TaxID=417368 RepID=UPI0022EBE92C|nr:amidohydrolase family protein [Enterococcus thailandicus]MDA3973932.1 amidohydrolase family protein [Enterococcus thailandicus]MDA3976257.1 amidohydrolase family protein [Enterococcus thailandicus]MDA3981222.1 amidohydrolase family protein [Enterococcus thailandicus]